MYKINDKHFIINVLKNPNCSIALQVYNITITFVRNFCVTSILQDTKQAWSSLQLYNISSNFFRKLIVNPACQDYKHVGEDMRGLGPEIVTVKLYKITTK